MSDQDAERRRVWVAGMERMLAAGVPVDARNAFRKYESREVCRVAGQWANGRQRLLCLAGSSGVGKSVAAALTVGRLGYAIWLHAHDLQALNPVDRHRWDAVLTCPLLVIDDLGVERLTDNVASVLDALVTKRYDGDRRTVLTTNVPASEIRERYGERIARRISDSGVFYEAAA